MNNLDKVLEQIKEHKDFGKGELKIITNEKIEVAELAEVVKTSKKSKLNLTSILKNIVRL